MAQTPRERETGRLYRVLKEACESGLMVSGASAQVMMEDINNAYNSGDLEKLREMLLSVDKLKRNERRRLLKRLRDAADADDSVAEELRERAQQLLEDESENFEKKWQAVDDFDGIGRATKAAGWQPPRRGTEEAEEDVTASAMDIPQKAVSTLRRGAPGYAEKRRPRRSFSRHGAMAEIPSLMQLQKKSYAAFLQRDVPAADRETRGLQNAFLSVFPMESSSGAVILHFKEYELRPPKYTVPECKLRGLSYESAVYARIEMALHEKRGGAVKDVKSETVYMGQLPLMTVDGSFVINGTERVVVSQLHRSPGVLFEHDSGRNTSGGKYLYSARIIPYGGSWVDFEFDKRDFLYFRIDRKRKMPVTILLKALGYDKARILREFYDAEDFTLGKAPGQAQYKLCSKFLRNMSLEFDLCDLSRKEKFSLENLDEAQVMADKLLSQEATAGEHKWAAGGVANLAEMREQGVTEINTYRVIVPRQHRIKKLDLRRIEPMEGKYHPVGDSFLYGRRLAEDIVAGRIVANTDAWIDAAFIESLSALRGKMLESDIVADDGEVLATAGSTVNDKLLRSLDNKDEDGQLPERKLSADVVVRDVVYAANDLIHQEMLDDLRAKKVNEIRTLYANEFDHGDFIAKTLALDEKLDEEKARETIYRMLRPGDPPNREVVNHHLDAILYDPASYNMSRVGRMKFNRRLHPGVPEREYDGRSGHGRKYETLPEKRPAMEYKVLVHEDSIRLNKAETAGAAKALAQFFASEEEAMEFLTYVKQFGPRRALAENLDKSRAEEIVKSLQDVLKTKINKQTTLSSLDILTAVKYLVELRNGKQKADDIDNLSNRRVRAVGEFIENQFYQGLQRVNRAIRDRLSRAEADNLMPHNLISAKAISSSVAEFFNGNQLSQFMDQTNPLAEITHKRRVSAFGAGGLNRDRVGFEVRDVHPSHYGRICPIETPEGPNIGLINSMSLYAEVDEYGFLRTPYVRVEKGAATDTVERLSAIDEQGKVIAQASNRRGKGGKFLDAMISARRDGEFILCAPEEVDYVDIAPAQIASVAASLIPFLEHDDANRALMGSNMQRQGVPCLYPEKPLVGTGVERLVVRDSGSIVQARRSGTVHFVDCNRIAIRARQEEIEPGGSGVDIYHLPRYSRSNQNTNISHRPIVREGDSVKAGDVIADGSATDMGEIALGQNLLVAFLPWNGYNYEDSILISERVVADQRFASVHIIEEVAHARSIPMLGNEEITRDIPHQSEASVSKLDDEGIIHIGMHVKPGDILVGKIAPKGERQLTPEEKLLQAVFGDKARDVKDTSLRMPPGSSGVVIDVKVFDGEEIKGELKRRDRAASSAAGRRLRTSQDTEIREFKQEQAEAWRIMEEDALLRIRNLAKGEVATVALGKIKKGATITDSGLDALKNDQLPKLRVKDEAKNNQIKSAETFLKNEKLRQASELQEHTVKLKDGHPLPQGILRTVKVYVAIKRNLQVGDKMAGRHGNKGVVSKVVPAESMPYLEDGTPVDVVLSPLGVPSRMNVGQILETHLGLAARGLGAKIEKMVLLERDKQLKEVRAFLKQVFAEDGNGFDVDSLSDDEVLETAANLKRGVPFATSIFDGAGEADIRRMLELADCPPSGQMTLYDGYSGEPFERPVTVGYMYIMKLHHLVDEKMHSRSTGPYSLITQQPLGGKAQRGGQRFGEMEVWALEAYGAAYTLCEMLTVKSDDIYWRTKMFEGISEGDLKLKTGVPESFNVLVQEIRALGIDMDFE